VCRCGRRSVLAIAGDSTLDLGSGEAFVNGCREAAKHFLDGVGMPLKLSKI
jgi:hypothetical protein